jgi:hypothetical protein
MLLFVEGKSVTCGCIGTGSYLYSIIDWKLPVQVNWLRYDKHDILTVCFGQFVTCFTHCVINRLIRLLATCSEGLRV